MIGASFGLAYRRARPGWDIVGFDRDPAASSVALRMGALTATAPSVPEAVRGADAVLVATPVDNTGDILELAAAALDPACVITDVGSTKSGVVALGESLVGEMFVGGHPMAGSELHGPEAASVALFEGATWILTPTARTSERAYTDAKDLVSAVGASTVVLDPALHDRLVARLSHVPQLVSSALATAAAAAGKPDLMRLAGSGFRDVTRLAASNPDMWVGILNHNREAVLDALEEVDAAVRQVEGLIRRGSWDDLRDWLLAARRAKLELFSKPGVGAESVTLAMVIPDRPGVLAGVTAAAGRVGVNIEDLHIDHAAEGGRGRLELTVVGEAAAATLRDELIRLGHGPDLLPGDDLETYRQEMK